MLTYKFILLGRHGVGKTCFTKRLNQEDPFENGGGHIVATVGVESSVQKISGVGENGESVMVDIYDVPGDDRYKNKVNSYFRGVHGVMVLFDLTSLKSFNDIEDYISQSEGHNPAWKSSYIIVGNKSDLCHSNSTTSRRWISPEDGVNLACKIREERELSCTYIQTSAKDNINVQESFKMLAKDVYKRSQKGEFKAPSGIKLNNTTRTVTSSYCCF